MIFSQYLSQRYDEKYPSEEFDSCHTIEPDVPEYQQVNRIAQGLFLRGEGFYHDRLLLNEKIALAEINLRTRGLIGLVLGSQIKKLMSPPALREPAPGGGR